MNRILKRPLGQGLMFLLLAMQPVALFAQDLWLNLPGASGKSGSGKKVVLISGDEEYRSEEALPMLAKILSEQHGFHCTVHFAIHPETKTVDPNYSSNIPGLEQLDDADFDEVFFAIIVRPPRGTTTVRTSTTPCSRSSFAPRGNTFEAIIGRSRG